MDRRRGIICHFKVNDENRSLSVTYTNDGTAVNRWLKQNVLGVRWLGLDIEWKPNFVKGQLPRPAAVLQLSTASACLVFHIIHTNIQPVRRLNYILANEEIVKVGCGIREDVMKLENCNYSCNCIVDIVDFAYEKTFIENRQHGLNSLCKCLLRKDFKRDQKSKEIQLSNWENFPLSRAQIEYAARDAWFSLRLFYYVKLRCYDEESLFAKSIGRLEEGWPIGRVNVTPPEESIERVNEIVPIAKEPMKKVNEALPKTSLGFSPGKLTEMELEATWCNEPNIFFEPLVWVFTCLIPMLLNFLILPLKFMLTMVWLFTKIVFIITAIMIILIGTCSYNAIILQTAHAQ